MPPPPQRLPSKAVKALLAVAVISLGIALILALSGCAVLGDMEERIEAFRQLNRGY